jgi:DNA repair exonuclease SbcCD ATPase subunit
MAKKGKGFDTGSARSRVEKANSNIEAAEARAERLEEDKRAVTDNRTQLESMNVSDTVAQEISEDYARTLDEIRSEAKEASEDLSESNSELEEVKQEAAEAKSENEKARSGVESVQKLLGAIGIHAMDGSLAEIDAENAKIDEVLDGATESMHRLQQVSGKLAGI